VLREKIITAKGKRVRLPTAAFLRISCRLTAIRGAASRKQTAETAEKTAGTAEVLRKDWNRQDAKNAKGLNAKAQRHKDAKEILRCAGMASLAPTNRQWMRLYEQYVGNLWVCGVILYAKQGIGIGEEG
jgi:hypothetical protein